MIKFISTILLFMLINRSGAEWRENNPMPGARIGASVVQLGSMFYIIGGKNQSEFLSDIIQYNPGIDSWDTTAVPDMITPRANASAVLFQNKIYVIGGRNKKGSCREVEFFDPDSNQWYVSQSLKGPRSGLYAVVLRDSLLIFGGIDSDGNYQDKVEWYDVANEKWEKLAQKMLPPRVGMFSFQQENNLFFSGGFYFSPLNSTAILTSSGNWEEGIPLSIARGDGATVAQGDSIFFVGGESVNGTTDIVEIYDSGTNEIYNFQKLPEPRAGHSAGIWRDSLYVFGGYRLHSTDMLSSVIVFHPSITDIGRASGSLELPDTFYPINSYPNPFNNTTNIEVVVQVSDQIDLKIFDVQGRLVDQLASGRIARGKHVYNWKINSDGPRQISSGVYIAVLRTSSQVFTHKLLYVK